LHYLTYGAKIGIGSGGGNGAVGILESDVREGTRALTAGDGCDLVNGCLDCLSPNCCFEIECVWPRRVILEVGVIVYTAATQLHTAIHIISL
jgi:hypothetical protein